LVVKLQVGAFQVGEGDKGEGLLLISMSLIFKGIIQIGMKENTFKNKYSRQVSNDDLSAKRPSSEENDKPGDTWVL
jgi:hypothetical protein